MATPITTLDKGRIFEVMSKLESNEPQSNEDQLEDLLDEQSDEEFGLPEFSEHVSSLNGPVVLKDWTAQDFASIYVRFRPHLERHAKRYLVNPSQVEEVVQDAFLYLMTTLPELDSEIGVLKFLKWKTRLLALDVIRANSRVSLSPLDADREFEANLPESSQDLERADDAAIVSLALAKLQPRHREALIATLYEEKSAALVSAQMGISENAFRQLLFRSRAAFKKALIGEAETAGLSISAVLSIAARKAAAESGKYISATGVFLLVIALSISVLPQMTTQPSPVAAVAPTPSDSGPTSFSSDSGPIGLEGSTPSAVADTGADLPNPSEPEDLASDFEAETISESELSETPELLGDGNVASNPDELLGSADLALETELLARLGKGAAIVLSNSPGSDTKYSNEFDGSTGEVSLNNGSGLVAHATYAMKKTPSIEGVWFEINLDGTAFVSAPTAWMSDIMFLPNGDSLLSYAATDLLVGDLSGDFNFLSVGNAEVSSGRVFIDLVIGSDGIVKNAELSFSPKPA